MSEKALSEIDAEKVYDLKVIDQHHGDTLSGSLIGVEQNDEELIVWIDTEME